MLHVRWLLAPLVVAALAPGADGQTEKDNTPPPGFKALFNGKNFDGWKVPEGDNGHWKILDGGVIDYDARSEAKKVKDLYTQKSFKNFTLRIDWRLKPDKGFLNKNVY